MAKFKVGLGVSGGIAAYKAVEAVPVVGDEVTIQIEAELVAK